MTKHFKTLALAAALATAASVAPAEEAIPTSLNTTEIPRYLGEWKVTLETDQFEMDFYLNVQDIEGKIGATVDSARQAEPVAIETITTSEEGVDFAFPFAMGEQSFTLHLLVKESAGDLAGTLREENGLFSGNVIGVEGSLDETEANRSKPTEAKMRVGEDKIRVTFGSLEMNSSDYTTLTSLSDDAVYTYIGSRATKLFTDIDLKFGDTIVKAHNFAPDYPGVYSLWLKRSGNDWALVVNEQPDVWGSQHDTKFDVATIPLKAESIDTPQENFLVTLAEQENGGQLKMAWGDKAWSTSFVAAQ